MVATDPTDIDMDKSNEEEKQPLRDTELTEGLHISSLACVQWERRWQESPLNGPLMDKMVFSMIANSVLDKGDKDSLTIQLYVFDCLPSSHRL